MCMLPYKDAETKIIADASLVGLGAVLFIMQVEAGVIVSSIIHKLKNSLACERFHAYVFGMSLITIPKRSFMSLDPSLVPE